MFSFLTKTAPVKNENISHSDSLSTQERFTQLEKDFLGQIGVEFSNNQSEINLAKKSVSTNIVTQKETLNVAPLENFQNSMEEECPPPIPLLVDEIEKAEGEIIINKAVNQKFKNSKAQLNQIIRQRTTYFDGLKERLNDLEEEKEQLNKELNNRKTYLEQREKEIQELINKISLCQQQSVEFSREISLAENKISKADNEIKNYQKQYLELAHIVEGLCAKYYEYEEHLEGQKAILNLKKSRTENLEKTKTFFKKSLPPSSPIRKEAPQSIN